MILEVAILNVRSGMTEEFSAAFSKAEPLISSQKGYIDHQLLKCVEKDHQFLLLVNWENVEAHEIGFRQSPEYRDWKKLLHHFYEPFPEVEHYC